MRNVVVVGAGLAGLAISGLLSKSGFAVRVVEARGDPTQQRGDAFRSINLALSARGIRTLGALGVVHDAMQNSVPMYGRRIHLADGSKDFQAYDLLGNSAIRSIRRSHLWQLLYCAAESNGAEIRFDTRCLNVDYDTQTITISDQAGRTSQLTYDALIGCDGAHSAVRKTLVECGCVVEEAYPMRHGYLELSIPREYAPGLENDGLHIWPRDDHMLVALPNTDGSFTATMFLPLEDARGNCQFTTPNNLLSVFHQKFPDAVALVQDLSAVLGENPVCRLFAIKCRPWSYAGSVLLIGDAAHTMAPFYGQGMNCALEDCWVLMRSVARFMDNWPHVFTDFERSRRPDADAITMLSDTNYREMSHLVAESEFKLRREIERALRIRFPSSFAPLYEMISFSTVPYAEALARSAAQAGIVGRLAMGLDNIASLDLEAEWLKNALGSGLDSEQEHVACGSSASHDRAVGLLKKTD